MSYALKYDFNFEPGEHEEQPGVCDALLILSAVFHKDGSISVLPMSVDGRTGKPLENSDLIAMLRVALLGRWNQPHTISQGKQQL